MLNGYKSNMPGREPGPLTTLRHHIILRHSNWSVIMCVNWRQINWSVWGRVCAVLFCAIHLRHNGRPEIERELKCKWKRNIGRRHEYWRLSRPNATKSKVFTFHLAAAPAGCAFFGAHFVVGYPILLSKQSDSRHVIFDIGKLCFNRFDFFHRIFAAFHFA